jgi:enoyl-CoA hydratase/carnithine racemase
MGSTVTVERAGDVAVVTLNRPDVLNALSRELCADLLAAARDLAADGALRAVVVTGAGNRAFSTGADLDERRALSPEERTAHTDEIAAAARAVEDLPVPTIAGLQGFALAGGAELALACDLRVADEGAVIGFPEVRVGIFPGADGVVRLPRLVGLGTARRLLFTGEQIQAAEAHRLGLVDVLVAPGEARAAALRLAHQIAGGAPLAVRALKQALLEARTRDEDAARAAVAILRRPLDATADYDEGLRAFAERRQPRFRGV